MEKGRANLSRRAEAPIAKLIKDILGLWEVDCGIAVETAGGIRRGTVGVIIAGNYVHKVLTARRHEHIDRAHHHVYNLPKRSPAWSSPPY